MNKRILTLLATLTSIAINQQSYAKNIMSQCMLGMPSYNRSFIKGDTEQLPITIHSDTVTGNYPNDAVFSGNVDIQQGNSRLQSDEVQLHQRQQAEQTRPIRTVDALGKVYYDDNQVILKGKKAWLNLNTKDTNVWNGAYQMVGRQGRGTATQIKLRGNNRYTIMENGSFTSCLPNSNSWSVVGSEIIQDRQEEVIEIWNARFKLGNIPIFYSPYLQLPIGNRRRSGFLTPNIKYSNNQGFEFIQPYYWNIANSSDLTISPHYMSKRGSQLQNEFRYLTPAGTGLVEIDYLGLDKQYKKEKAVRSIPKNNNFKRWLLFWRHAGAYDQHWHFSADYTKVSDQFYFNDLTSPYYSSTDGYAKQKFSVGYADTDWNATLSTKDFQIFKNTSNNVYRAIPQLDINWYRNNIGPFDGHIYAQATKLINVNSHYPETTRLHAEPGLSLPLSNGWARLNSEIKLLASHYQQNDVEYYNTNIAPTSTASGRLKNSVNRTLPQFKIDSHLVLNRAMNSEKGYTQILEPRIQYLYIPYHNQSNIYPYDSTLLQTDYTGLFRDRSYSALDRIASANQMASGVTTRIYDNDLVERFNISLGQIYSFTTSRTGVQQIDKANDTGSVIWAGNSYWKISNQWDMGVRLQYDTHLNNISQAQTLLEYRHDTDSMMQLSYRYSNPNYVAATLNNNDLVNNPIYKKGISQLGTTASWPIKDEWSVVGAYYYDISNNRPASQLVSMQYHSCCYAVRVGYERKINGWENNDSKYDNQVSFNIELRGLVSNYSSSTKDMLHQGIIPYQHGF